MVEIVAMVETVMVKLEMVVDLIANAVKVDLLVLKREKAIKIEMTETMEIKVKEKVNSIEMAKAKISKEKVNSIEMVDKTEFRVDKVAETKIADKVEINKIAKVLLETEIVLWLPLLQWKKTKRLLQRKLLLRKRQFTQRKIKNLS